MCIDHKSVFINKNTKSGVYFHKHGSFSTQVGNSCKAAHGPFQLAKSIGGTTDGGG